MYNSSWFTLQSSFFAHFMCFEVPTLVPPGGVVNGNKAGYDDDDDLGIMDIDENDSKSGIYAWLFSNSGFVLLKLRSASNTLFNTHSNTPSLIGWNICVPHHFMWISFPKCGIHMISLNKRVSVEKRVLLALLFEVIYVL